MVAEAAALVRHGLVLVPGLPDTDGRREIELDLQVTLGLALTASRGWGAPELAEVYSRARQLALTLNRPRALLSALWGQFLDRWARSDLEGAERLAAELRGLGDTAGDVIMQVVGCAAGGSTHFQRGEFTTGREYLEKALALYDPAHRPSYAEVLPNDARVQLRTQSAWLLTSAGHFDQATFQIDAALSEARRLSHPLTLNWALSAVWWTGWFVRLEPGSLLQYADEALALATEHGLGFERAMALFWRGWCLTALARAEEGIPLITAGVADWDELGVIIWKPCVLTLLGDAYRMAGQWQTALGHVMEARRLAQGD
jgi:tetratricopeptide (TPR) repeat protein